MAEELVMTVKSNISTVTTEVNDLTSSLDKATFQFDDLSQSISAQKEHINDLKRTLIELKAAEDAIPEGAWHAGRQDLLDQIRETSLELDREKNSLTELNIKRSEASEVIKKNKADQRSFNKLIKSGVGNYRVMGLSINQLRKYSLAAIPTIKLMFTSIKVGIMSTGIGALIVAAGVLVTWLVTSSKVAKFFSNIFRDIGVVVSVVVDRITAFGDAITKIFSGDWAGAWAGLKAAVSGVGDEMEREIKLARELEERQAALIETERALNVEMAKKGEHMDELKRLADDETRSQEDRIQAVEDLADIEAGFSDQQANNILAHMQNIRDTIELNGKSAESLDQLANAEIQLANIRRKAAGKEAASIKKIDKIRVKSSRGRSSRSKKLAKQEKDIAAATRKAHNDTVELMQQLYYKQLKTAQEVELAILHTANEKIRKKTELELDAAKAGTDLHDKLLLKLGYLEQTYLENRKEINDKYTDQAKEKAAAEAVTLQDLRDQTTLSLIKDLETRALAALEIEKKKEDDILKLQDNYAEMKIELDKKYARAEKKITDESVANTKAADLAKLDSQIAAFSQLSGALSTLAGDNKHLAAAGAIIDTYAGANKAFAQGGVAGFISGAAIIAAGLANVRSIYATDVGGEGGGGAGNIDVPAEPPAPEMMSGAFTLGGGQAVEPARAYVVSDDITANQDKLAIIRRRATI